MNAIEYAFYPALFFMFGVGFWLGMKVAERDKCERGPDGYCARCHESMYP
jgi:hypothetical protein